MFFDKQVYAGISIILISSLLPAVVQATSARLFVKPVNYVGSCPSRFQFSGIIHSHYAGKVQYRFLRSDNANTPVQTIVFLRPGEKKVTSSWTLGSEGLPQYEGWQMLEVIYPVRIVSNKARFTIDCRRGGF